MRIKKNALLLFMVFIALVLGFSCEEEPDIPAGPYKVITESISSCYTPEDMVNVMPGETFFLRINREGFEVREYPVHLEGYHWEDQDLYFRSPEGIMIGHGDSGSPIVDENGTLVAVTYAIWHGNTKQFIARPGYQVWNVEEYNPVNPDSTLASYTSQSSQSMKASNSRGIEYGSKVDLAHFRAQGISAATLNKAVQESSSANIHRLVLESNDHYGLGRAMVDPQTVSVIPGMSIAVQVVFGDWITIESSGTISLTKSQNGGSYLHAFGHSFFDPGFSSLPVYLAEMHLFNENAGYPYKVTENTGRYLGKLVKDTFSGIRIEDAAHRDHSTVIVNVKKNGGSEDTSKHYVSHLTRFSDERTYNLIAAFQPVYYAAYGDYSNDGTIVIESLTMENEAGQIYSLPAIQILTPDVIADPDSEALNGSDSDLYDAFDKLWDYIGTHMPTGDHMRSITLTVDYQRN